MNIDADALVAMAREASKRSYSPYSGFPVGAAVIAESGEVYTGTNIENASYGATMCAERVAIFKAASDGLRRIVALAVYGGGTDYAYPCGLCLQVLSDVAGDIPVYVSGKAGVKRYALSELLPHPFDKSKL